MRRMHCMLLESLLGVQQHAALQGMRSRACSSSRREVSVSLQHELSKERALCWEALPCVVGKVGMLLCHHSLVGM